MKQQPANADTSEDNQHDGQSAVARPIERNIRALVERRERELAGEGFVSKVAAAIASFAGSVWSVILHAAVFGFWILVNTGLLPVVRPWDPSLVVLAMAASVEAIFLTTFVLMNQNRSARIEDQRAELTLQISLLAEHEMTKLVEIASAIAQHLGITSPSPSELDELKENVTPEAVLDEIERERSRRNE
ncbi:DUF1003 domain-containing protein [Mesorhizobium sp. RMAD-H1]|uniref:DUF1003 domain-containing protein n=1 Tax=Mesorhizobium sp. RMAD-H1 TaxID=2587065 RepID=UPI0016159F13|nr:DUF1003 domain-containing protein [Mesorhizobium sp. RMAD-H1]MBB2972833.1 putative membrane protein [Mesorhizobium sp. RMAD-H1]